MNAFHKRTRKSVDRINGDQLLPLEQRQTSQAKKGMEDIRLVTWSVCNAASVCVLTLSLRMTGEDETLKSVSRDPMVLCDDFKLGQYPPAVANVR